jgi:hypothetical protein
VEDGESAQASKKQDELSEVVVEGGGGVVAKRYV